MGNNYGFTSTEGSRPVYIESCACVVKNVVKCKFEYLSVVHHTRRHSPPT